MRPTARPLAPREDELARGESGEEPVGSVGVGRDADTDLSVGVADAGCLVEAAHPSAPIPARTTR